MQNGSNVNLLTICVKLTRRICTRLAEYHNDHRLSTSLQPSYLHDTTQSQQNHTRNGQLITFLKTRAVTNYCAAPKPSTSRPWTSLGIAQHCPRKISKVRPRLSWPSLGSSKSRTASNVVAENRKRIHANHQRLRMQDSKQPCIDLQRVLTSHRWWDPGMRNWQESWASRWVVSQCQRENWASHPAAQTRP